MRLIQAWRKKPINTATNEKGDVQRTAVVRNAPAAGVSVNSSADVMTAQSLLAGLGYDPGPADGQIGPRTRDAILLFEERSSMLRSGRVSRQLVEKLRSLSG